ncbi:MAG: hypothetical protein HUJ22_09435 [Gracilimonas sp.]|uniref:hypothetical protein n=1 Tax=Gracilimonas sp. TaxID=1974203 RepID=UPI00199777EA|nr:hypothetical protein [Gracilimonas sp.]MBD3616784.1 hypothetical protein [Gracilimonas sp.]
MIKSYYLVHTLSERGNAMKITIAVIILFHGLIHITGFLKAFDLAEVEELKMPITKSSGIIWLITSLIFIATSVFYLADSYFYIGLGVSGVTLSQALILQHWKYAKYGTIPNLILGIILFLSI